jgi:hypothetical protein
MENYMYPVFHKLSKEEFLNPDDKEKYKLGLIYAKKNSTNFFKLFYYTLISISGYLVLHNLPYFPKLLFGNGKYSQMFEAGYPDCFYHEKPDYFNIYYLGALAFHITDLIWLLGVYELQSDFLMMVVHHICTISLITFSYLVNYSHAGSIIIFLHDTGDIFVYIARIFLNTKAPEWTKVSSAVLLLLVWIYTRIYVLMFIIIDIYVGFSTHFNLVNRTLWSLLCFLFVLHCYWVFLIGKKIFFAVFAKKYEDTFKLKKAR